jgi:hypothetical protein
VLVGLSMAERKAVTRQMASRYAKASKEQKGVMLDELCALTSWHRDYARRALRTVAGRPTRRRGEPTPRRRRRPPVYDEAVLNDLRSVWVLMDFACGKRLAAIMGEILEALERHGELRLEPPAKAKLLSMSAATMDRRLAADRKRFQIRGRSGTKPGSLLKGQIPIRTFSDWDDTRPGFVQADLVAHCGPSGVGEFCQTLTLTDVATGWTEPRALKNKARRWVVAAIDEVGGVLPFALLGIDSDNGSEFINDHLLAYCNQHQITFTRGRPYRKNDSCHVEQKNWTVVRQAVGYARYDTDIELAALGELYGYLRLFTNFFGPQAKLTGKTRQGAKIVRRYDKPVTPYQRVLDSGVLTKTQARQLTAYYQTLNPAQLRRDISRCQRRLRDLNNMKIQTA